MALTAPTPPTPPTPPTVPKVTLGGGGSVTETQGPVSGQRSENDESQARAAVARGDGPLSRTTTEDPQDSSANGQASSNASNQNGQTGQNAQTAQQSGQQASDGSAALLGGDAGTGSDGSADDAQSAKEAQALEEGRVQHPDTALGSHGVLYIGFSLVTFVALAVLLYRWLKKRRAEHRDGLHYGDFAGDIDAGREEAAEDETLRGRTAGEILGDIEREEERELAIARARAAEYQRQQAREQAARERRKQEREEAAARKEKEALRAKAAEQKKRQPAEDEDDKPHFDLRA